MSVNGSLSGISFAGLGSGIDTASIVSQLMQIERIPVQRMQANQARLEARLAIYEQLNSKVTALRTAASSLNAATAFNPITGSVTDTAVASLSVSSAASAGTFALTVKTLAQANKIVSGSQLGSDSALNLTGDVVINGKSVNVVATDTLSAVASKINGAGAGVTASILGGTGGAYLTLTAQESGAANKIQLSDSAGTVLSSLGLVSGAASYREAVTDGFRSFGFKSSTDTLNTLTGLSKSGSFQIGTETINVNYSTDSLATIASSINSALGGVGVTATVVDATVGSKSVKKLEVTGLGANTVVDTNGILSDIGVLSRSSTNEPVVARDASYLIDGIQRSSYTNAVSDAVSGVTINLLKDETQGTATTTINLNRDNTKIKDSFKSYKEAFNGLIDYVKLNSAFDSKTFQSGPLFGDTAASQVVAAVQNAVFQQAVPTGTIRNLTDLGFGLDSDGKLTLDEAQLDKAISTDIDSVKKVMVSSGSTNNTELSFLSSTSRTQDPGTAGFSVSITQAATKSRTLASVAQTVANRGGETLTFTGSAFASSVDLNVSLGASLADVMNLINSDSRLKDKVVASIDGAGKLQVDSLKFGSVADFKVTSNLVADVDTTGIGTDGGVYTSGLDVAGTINGEETVGTGQYLTGKDTNATSGGLQLLYTGSSIGSIGIVSFTRGLSARMLGAADNITDPINGQLTAQSKAIQTQVEDLTSKITSYNEILVIREQTLRNKFLAMERAISQLQAQQSQLSSFTNS